MKAVVLGWKRDNLKNYCDDCEKICYKLAKDGYDIYSGGGYGFMESANKGAFRNDKLKSFGITTECLKEERNTNIIDSNFHIKDTFSERKNALINNYDLIIFFPGGIGTLDEFTEVMNLLKLKQIEFKQIILYGYKYWNSLISWFEFNKINFPDKFITGIVDNIEEFNKLYLNFKKTNILTSQKSENTIEEIKEYEPIFRKKKIFNPLDDIDDLIDSIFNDPNIFNNLKSSDINKQQIIKFEEENQSIQSSDDDVIIEFVYESSDSNNKSSSDDVKEINPINFISDSESDNYSNDE